MRGRARRRARTQRKAWGGSLIAPVQPASSPAPSFGVIMADGKFHGVRSSCGTDVVSVTCAWELRWGDVHDTCRKACKGGQRKTPVKWAVPTGCLTTMLRNLGMVEGICCNEPYMRKQKGDRGNRQDIPPYVHIAFSAVIVPPVCSVVQPKKDQGTH